MTKVKPEVREDSPTKSSPHFLSMFSRQRWDLQTHCLPRQGNIQSTIDEYSLATNL
jgi:hypothetical protein